MKISRSLLAAGSAVIALSVSSAAFAGDVTGVVVDQTDTIALQSAEVRIVELNRVTSSQRDGSFIFADVPEGTYTIQASYIGAPVAKQTITVPETGRVRANFALGDDATPQILVVGQGANQASALSRKRASDVVSDVITRDAMGQFPDQNVAESLRRLPGINVLNDQGEGRFVSVRGLDPDLVSTSVNGVNLPSPESDVRSVALDVISSDIIESIEVKKSLTPDMDADTIGASVEIKTTSAFDRRKAYFSAKAEGSYNDYADHVSPKGSVDFSTRLGDNFGVTGGLSYYKRKFETDNVEAADWEEKDGLIYAEEVEYRDYDVERERISATLNFDARLSDTTSLYLRGLYSQFDDQEYRRRTTFKMGDANVSGSGTNVLFDDDDAEVEVERDIKDRMESQRIRSISAGGETDTGDWHAEYMVSWAKSSEKESGSVDTAKFERKFENEGTQVGFDYSDPRVPLYSVISGPADFNDPSTYGLDDLELTTLSDAQDEEYAAKFDLARSFYTDAGEFTMQAGFKGRWREKTYDKNAEFYEDDDFTLADALGEQSYRIIDMGPVASYRGATEFFNANRDLFELQDIDTAFDSAAEDYSIDEDIMAGYVLGRWDSNTLRVIGGVRYEHTKNDITGNETLLVEEGGALPDGTPAADDTVLVTPVNYKRNYDHWLPSLNIRFAPEENTVFRLAGYRSLVRPKLGKLAPRFVVEENDDGERDGEFGNPNLLPYEAWNFDASAEYYMSSNGAITAAVFYKDVKNFIVDTVQKDGSYLGIPYDEAEIPINGDSAEIYGAEIGISQQFSMLPAPFDGLIAQLNYTYTNATGNVPTDGDINDLREITLPATSKHTMNATLGYDKGPLSLRVSGTYRDKYLDELGDEAQEDRYVDNHFQLDLSAKYRVNKNVQMFYEWVNINNAKYFAYNNFGGQRNLVQYEEYNWTMKAGVKVTF
ncbi:TonB-dependent receptor [Altericroceibacterium endophyticum]|uniref:TonB-dependent receptor n=1 Tax=Altericroceibacterium endophyticum TaxID=1808508 RepID=A0A6I4TBV3_9SPHN|nr:TonB-dependent receptor [Altericroceibacterium endophyticum]MXO67215.1 TonB-dependent receptor [Altericroceibacterium endophyticum]